MNILRKIGIQAPPPEELQPSSVIQDASASVATAPQEDTYTGGLDETTQIAQVSETPTGQAEDLEAQAADQGLAVTSVAEAHEAALNSEVDAPVPDLEPASSVETPEQSLQEGTALEEPYLATSGEADAQAQIQDSSVPQGEVSSATGDSGASDPAA